MYCRWRSRYQERRVGIQLTGFFCARPRTGISNVISYVVVFFCVWRAHLRWEVIVRASSCEMRGNCSGEFIWDERWKRNSDCHQFHQYQQNEQSPLISNELARTITSHLKWIRQNNHLSSQMNSPEQFPLISHELARTITSHLSFHKVHVMYFLNLQQHE
jgi:hypothetical protein